MEVLVCRIIMSQPLWVLYNFSIHVRGQKNPHLELERFIFLWENHA